MTTSTAGAGLLDTLASTGNVRPGPRDERLDAIGAKALAGKRLTLEEGRVLYDTPDIWGVCELADAL
ncbi:MAG: hypothetical protein ACTS27_13115, partial [Phycisphaerales bacterium]